MFNNIYKVCQVVVSTLNTYGWTGHYYYSLFLSLNFLQLSFRFTGLDNTFVEYLFSLQEISLVGDHQAIERIETWKNSPGVLP